MSKNPNLLLSEERRKKVEKKVLECLKIAKKKYKQDFELPEIRYDVKNTDGGLAYHTKWLIRLNLILMVENEDHFLNTTVPHEVAHLVARRVYHDKLAAQGVKMKAHGKEWKEVMALFEVPAKVTHSYDCSSIQKPKRRPRGSKLQGSEADLLLHRLTVAAKRMPKRHLQTFIHQLNVLYEDLE